MVFLALAINDSPKQNPQILFIQMNKSSTEELMDVTDERNIYHAKNDFHCLSMFMGTLQTLTI